VIVMKYKDHEYTILQTANPTGWKWVIQLDQNRTKSGTAYNKMSAIKFAEFAIEKHLKRSGRRKLSSYGDHISSRRPLKTG
jgi:hypothetical protein